MPALELPDEIGDPDPDEIVSIIYSEHMGTSREELRRMVIKAIQESCSHSPEEPRHGRKTAA